MLKLFSRSNRQVTYRKFLITAITCSAIALTGCGSGSRNDTTTGAIRNDTSNGVTPTSRGDLLTYEKVATRTISEVNTNTPEFDLAEYLKYDLEFYRVTYSSEYRQKPIALSGLVIVPKSDQSLPHLQYHHGTMFPFPDASGFGNEDTPSLYVGQGPTPKVNQFASRVLGSLAASVGYVVSLPDYAGYGVSDNVGHPYAYHPELAIESVDLIIATRKLMATLKQPLTENLFLTGWSEGGGAALATHKLIEEQYSDQLPLTASAPFAGPYAMVRSAKWFVGKNEE
ncbi:MAG: hypothetical protein V7785_00675 [Bermanella sp.]